MAMEMVDTILYGGTVVTMNQQFDLIPDGALAINGTNIVGVGTRADILARFASQNACDCGGGALFL